MPLQDTPLQMGPLARRAPRAVMTVIYMADGIQLIEPQRKRRYADWEAFMHGIKPGEPAASLLNPIL